MPLTPRDQNSSPTSLRLEFPRAYHVRINFKDSRWELYALDKDADWIEQRIAAPIRNGRDAFIDGQVISWPDIREIHIVQTEPASTPPAATASADVIPDVSRWPAPHSLETGRAVTSLGLGGGTSGEPFPTAPGVPRRFPTPPPGPPEAPLRGHSHQR